VNGAKALNPPGAGLPAPATAPGVAFSGKTNASDSLTAAAPTAPTAHAEVPLVRAAGLTLAPAGTVILRDLNFDIRRGEVLVIVGGSGCGKSVLLRHLIGLQAPAAGRILYGVQGRELDLYGCGEAELAQIRRCFGVMFQAGALWSSMSVGENLMLPMRLFTPLARAERQARARDKLALVGLAGSFDLAPAQLSGGMKKRVAIARALALDPQLVYLDEPASGLDPVNTQRLDELILSLRANLGTTVVMVTHEIDSVFAVADRALFLDAEENTMLALDTPAQLAAHGPARVREFLSHANHLGPMALLDAASPVSGSVSGPLSGPLSGTVLNPALGAARLEPRT
jgi:phospholipid/cholesterol/gamma-HCH transport system ATP-binding protein